MGVGHPARRVRWMLVAVLFVFSLFCAQLLRLQALDASTLASAALGSRTQTVVIPALRGSITDARGTVLAYSSLREDITADPQALRNPRDLSAITARQEQANVLAAATRLAPLLGKSAQDIATRVNSTRAGSKFVYLVKDVSPLVWAKVQGLGIGGISNETTTSRQYPTSSAAASLVGWVGTDGQPGGGLELMENKALTGTPGTKTYQRSGFGLPIASAGQSMRPATNGATVRLSINSDLQYYAQNVLAEQVQALGAQSGNVVALDPRTGRILAVASSPTFDPNRVGAAKGDLVNTAFDQTFEPGSTAKVMVASTALATGTATPASHVTVPPGLARGGALFHDSEAHGTESLTFAGVLAKSSNMGAILVGEHIPPSTLYRYYRRFGMGTTSGIGFPGETGGLLERPDTWSGSQRYTVLFGQGFSATAMQTASVFQTIANGGVRVPLSLVAGTQRPGGPFVPAPRTTPVRVIPTRVAKAVSAMMEGVVGKNGTAPKAEVKGYRIAGKTGTADRYDQSLGRYAGVTASFIGYAPADNPRIEIAVTVQRPRGLIYGGDVAAPVFAKVMQYALQEYKVPPTGTRAPHLPLTFDPAKHSRQKHFKP